MNFKNLHFFFLLESEILENYGALTEMVIVSLSVCDMYKDLFMKEKRTGEQYALLCQIMLRCKHRRYINIVQKKKT